MTNKNSIMDWMTAIFNESSRCGLSESFFSAESKAYDALCRLSKAFDVSPFQAVMLSIITLINNVVDVRIICNYTGCLISELLSRKDDFTYLVNRGLITQSNHPFLTANFKIAPAAMEKWIENLPFVAEMDAKDVHNEMVSSLESKFSALENGTTDAASLKQTVLAYLDMYHDSHLTQKLYSYWKNPSDSWNELASVLYLFIVMYRENQFLLELQISRMLFDTDSDENMAKTRRIMISLKKKGFIPGVGPFGVVQLSKEYVDIFHCKRKSQETGNQVADNNPVLEEKSNQAVLGDGVCTFIAGKGIREKELFYNNSECECLDELMDLFSTEKFNEVVERMQKNGMRTGFNCLLYGAPGTGKTEFVNQLARCCGRDIIKADFSELMNRYIGDSEKAIRKIFAVYREQTEKLDAVPILLLNECDGLLGKRIEATDSTDQLYNTCQTILLEELENLYGICICTTNIPRNMDEAFERRFLYKIEFHNPDESTRREIWHSLKPELSDNEISELASNYRLSGGQIENVVRKIDIYNIIHGIEHTSLETIKSRCQTEVMSYNKHSLSDRKIGFNS